MQNHVPQNEALEKGRDESSTFKSQVLDLERSEEAVKVLQTKVNSIVVKGRVQMSQSRIVPPAAH